LAFVHRRPFWLPHPSRNHFRGTGYTAPVPAGDGQNISRLFKNIEDRLVFAHLQRYTLTIAEGDFMPEFRF
jgi:hypothetical protein